MTMTLTLSWWAIPAVITTLALAWALFWPCDDSGNLGGMVVMFNVMIALVISLLAWAIAGALK